MQILDQSKPLTCLNCGEGLMFDEVDPAVISCPNCDGEDIEINY